MSDSRADGLGEILSASDTDVRFYVVECERLLALGIAIPTFHAWMVSRYDVD